MNLLLILIEEAVLDAMLAAGAKEKGPSTANDVHAIGPSYWADAVLLPREGRARRTQHADNTDLWPAA